MKLYEVNHMIVDLKNKLASGELDEQTVQDTLEGVLPIMQEKAKNISAMILNLQSDVRELKLAEERIMKRRKSAEKSAKWWLDHLLHSMETCDVNEIKTDEFVAKLQRNPVKVVIDDIDNLPTKYVTQKVTLSAKKKSLREALQAGEKIEGVELLKSNRVAFK